MNHFYILAWFRLWVEMVWLDHLWRTTWTCPTCRCPSTCRYCPKRSPAIWKSWSSSLKHSSKGASNWDSPRWQSTQADDQLGGAFIHSKAKRLLFWFEGRTNTPCRNSQETNHVFMVCCREMWALLWGNYTGTTSARRRSLASKRSTSVSRTCASSNLCWRNGWVMQVSRVVLLLKQPPADFSLMSH